MARISQEFYCGHCNGYFVARINTAINHEVEMVCPNCDHKHRRCIKEGHILEEGRYQSKEAKERILVPKTSYSKTPITEAMRKKSALHRRDGEPIAQELLHESWLSAAAREKEGE